MILPACSSVSLSDIDLMGQSEFNDEVSGLEMSFPSPDETPDMPENVRSARDWDKAAREMEALYDAVDVPELEPALTPEEFDRQFDEGQAEAKAYKEDDPS